MASRRQRPGRKHKGEKKDLALPRERVYQPKKRDAAVAPSSDLQPPQLEMKVAQDRTDNVAVTSVPPPIRNGKGGGILKLDTRAQLMEVERYQKKRNKRENAVALPSTDPKGTGRLLGEKPTMEDLRKVTFRQSNKFHMNEIVLVPR